MFRLNIYSRYTCFGSFRTDWLIMIFSRRRINYCKLTCGTDYFMRSCSTQGTLQRLDNAYNPLSVQNELYDYWIKQGVCQPKPVSNNLHSTTFSLLLPPPNITGMLHLGHSLTVTIQDVLARWHRMCGNRVLWVPGLDHAGIATQTTFEKALWKERKETRYNLGRERFQKELWNWQSDKRDIIIEQLKKMGVTLDWSREYFTLDDKHSAAVTEAFIRLHDNGLIYRSECLINWSCKLQSAISDIEVNHLNIEGPTFLNVPNYEAPVEFGILTNFAYKHVDNDNELVVSTTRLETMLGDTAVAVNPNDERYVQWHGAELWHPIRKETIPVICDESVDPSFGTGVVKITPAHSLVDFEIGKKNNLRNLSVINEDGNMNELCGSYDGLKRYEARQKLKDELIARNLFREQRDHAMSVPICSRTGDVVEYLLKPQWFLSCQEMSKMALAAVESGNLCLIPHSYKNVWISWLEDTRDWCLSRQIWWGHRIPAYECNIEGNTQSIWVSATSLNEAREKAARNFNLLPEEWSKIKIRQDEDVLDTWFSSALLPFAVHGWPCETQDLKEFYPLSLMETGHDILFFWVARMVMLGTYLTGKLPFKKVLLHGIVCDSYGRKMSKSLGNVIDPQDVIYGATTKELIEKAKKNYKLGLFSEEELNKSLESTKKLFPNGIPECGSDALRFSLCSHAITNAHVNFDVTLCHANRHFCNKMWQACRYIERSLEDVRDIWKTTEAVPPSKLDKWIMSRLAFLVEEVNTAFTTESFHTATEVLKYFIYDEVCSTYLEGTKPVVKAHNSASVKTVETLLFCMDNALRALSPFMPFLTEHLYQHLSLLRKGTVAETIAWATYPTSKEFQLHRDEKLEKEVSSVLEIISSVRHLKAEHGISKKDNPVGYIEFSCDNDLQQYSEYKTMMTFLTGLSKLEIIAEVPENIKHNAINAKFREKNCIYVKASRKKDETNDILAKAKRYKSIVKDLNKLYKKTAKPRFSSYLPPHIQNAYKERIAKLEAELQEFKIFEEKIKEILASENVEVKV